MSVYIILIMVLIFLIPIIKLSQRGYLIIGLILIWGILSFRDFSVGSDTLTYASLYSQLGTQQLSGGIITQLFNGRFEVGYVVLNKILYAINTNPRLLLIVTATIEVIGVGYFLDQLSPNIPTSLILFVTMNFLSTSMNALRQCIALSLALIGVTFLIKNMDWQFFVMIVTASLFHKTSLVLLILYPLWKMKINFPMVTILFLGAVSFFVLFDKWFGFLTSHVDSYTEYANSSSLGAGQLALYLQIMVISSIAIFCLASAWPAKSEINKLPYFNFKTWQFLMMMLILSIIVSFIALKFSQINRISIFFNAAYLVLIPRAVSLTKSAVNRLLENIGIISLSVAYFIIIQVYRPEWFRIVPYFFF